jgi:hypothetical protein
MWLTHARGQSWEGFKKDFGPVTVQPPPKAGDKNYPRLVLKPDWVNFPRIPIIACDGPVLLENLSNIFVKFNENKYREAKELVLKTANEFTPFALGNAGSDGLTYSAWIQAASIVGQVMKASQIASEVGLAQALEYVNEQCHEEVIGTHTNAALRKWPPVVWQNLHRPSILGATSVYAFNRALASSMIYQFGLEGGLVVQDTIHEFRLVARHGLGAWACYVLSDWLRNGGVGVCHGCREPMVKRGKRKHHNDACKQLAYRKRETAA